MKKLYYILIISVLGIGCAQQSGLSGGEKDIEAPKIDTDRTFPKNRSTHFSSNQIVISFNEFIRLTNPNQNIVITPSLNLKPTYELKGRKISINFRENLDPNTTYTINFGNSISDITEGNKLLNYSYVFSTGAVLDSLTIRGNIYDAFLKTTKGNILVGLYKTFEDSVGLKEVPYYFTKTSDNGSFQFNNLKEGSYTLLAIEDDNNNLKYDRYTESVSFLDSSLLVRNDTLKTQYNMSLFKEEQSKNWIVSKKYKHPGAINIVLKKKAELVKLKLLNNSFANGKVEQNFIETDSIYFWISNIDSVTAVQLVCQLDKEVIDTLKIKVKKPKLSRDTILRFKTNTANNLAYFAPIVLTFKTPIKEINRENALLFDEDSVRLPFEMDFKENKVEIKADFEEDVDYELYLYPNLVIDRYDTGNDSAHLFFSIIPMNKYGNIVLHYEREVNKNQQIIQLLKDNIVLEEHIVDSKTKTFEFRDLAPGNYQLKAINDSNNNGKWDTGDYLLRNQPELVKLFEDKIDLKAGWDLDLTWLN